MADKNIFSLKQFSLSKRKIIITKLKVFYRYSIKDKLFCKVQLTFRFRVFFLTLKFYFFKYV